MLVRALSAERERAFNAFSAVIDELLYATDTALQRVKDTLQRGMG
jgi:hypothetical protein